MASPMSTMSIEDRWFVISTNKTDFVDDTLERLKDLMSIKMTVIDEELENRNALLQLAAE